MNKMRTVLYSYLLLSLMPYAHAVNLDMPDIVADALFASDGQHDGRKPKCIEITHPGHYEIRYVHNQLALVDCDDERRLYNLQAAIQPGSFSLPANINVTNQFVIAANQVQMDLAGHKVQGGIVVAPNKSDIKIMNGLVGGKFASGLTNGILVNAGCTNVRLDGLQITNATTGINFSNVTVGLIANCDLSQNSTGVLLQGSSQITIQNSVALNSTNVGFQLVSSSTCAIIDSRALSTGQGNVQLSGATICGFISTNGNANIFENCIANSTQALSTTDSGSIVAGFALLGTESNSKITGCESANAATSSNGVTVPYGILLQATVNNPLTLTATPVNPVPSASVFAVNWAPGADYLAVGLYSASPVALLPVTVYKLNRQTGTLNRVANVGANGSITVQTVSWSPDGTYLAVGTGAATVLVYSFDTINNSLNLVASITVVGGVSGVDWSSDGNYLTSIESTTSNQIRVYNFNRTTNTLTQVAVTSVAGGTLLGTGIKWSPNGAFLATALTNNASTSGSLGIYSFTRGSNTLTLVASDSTFTAGVYAVSWSYDGAYLAVGSEGAVGQLRVYSFNASNTLLLQASVSVGAGGIITLAWSSDGQYIVTGLVTAPQYVRVFYFDRGADTLTQVSTPNIGPGTVVRSIDWSSDGGFIAAGVGTVAIYNALSFPSKNVITSNTVYCNSGASIPSGIGIFGSSVANMIIQNIAYSNPINPFMVNNNYAFAQNVYNQLFGSAPTGVQNISIGYRDPVILQDNLALIARQINSQLSNQFFSSINVFQSALSTMMTTTLSGGPCAPTPIFQANLPTTIGTSGVYCLGQNVSLATQMITVTVDNVVIDLSNHKITNTSTSPAININSGARNNIFIKNGYIEQTMTGTAITMTTGGTNLTLQDLIIKTNGGTAVACTNVNNGLIKNCTFTNSLIGALLTNCVGINFDSSQTRDCSLKGFELISSVTCSFINCKAISTGAGNSQTSGQVIAGFYSNMGSGNVFENCIANGTQGLNLIDFDSVVAGFMLTGTETYSKIIGCESSNSVVGPNAYAVPYGILLDNVLGSAIFPVFSGDVSLHGVTYLSWSPNGKYILATNTSYNSNAVYLFKFDRLTRSLIQLTVLQDYVFSENFVAVWSPDGQYVAAGIGNTVIFKFDQMTESLTEVVQIETGETPSPYTPYDYDFITALAWSPDGNYLAVGSGRFFGVEIVKVDRVAQTFTIVASHNFGSQFYELDWSPDGQFLALATLSNQIFLYQWDRVNNQLILKDSHFTPSYEAIRDVRWSPDGLYLAVGATDELIIYSLNKTAATLTNILTVNPGGYFGSYPSQITQIRWSPDGKYLVIVGNPIGYPTANDTFIYEFNRQTISLNLNIAVNPGGSSQVLSAAWSPDGAYLALGRENPSHTGSDLFIYTAFNFPQNCVIKNNVTYCNTGGVQSRGVGISGSSASNLIVGNTAYSNPVTPFMVNENYHFVTNVFNPLFENTPALFENISLGYQQVIPTPDNEALLAGQLIAAVNTIGLCGPTALTSLNSIGGTISLSTSGYYCLSQDLTTDISITATCVVLDLNSRALTGSIYVNTSDDVIVRNGFVTPATYAPASNIAPPAAVNVYNSSVRTTISGLNIVCANSSSDGAGDGIAGRTGIYIEGIDTIVRDCSIVAGSGSNATNATVGGNGGNGIELSSTFTAVRPIIINCVIYATGNGGNGSSNSGGNGGFGIKVGNALNASIQSVTVFSTGNGGNGSGAGNTAGSGGHGIEVLATAIGTEVLNSILRNTGTVGTASGGATAGLKGKAVDDHVTVTANLSKVFSNFAHDIASATKFDLQASGFERGTLIPNPPGQSVFNILANVFTSQ